MNTDILREHRLVLIDVGGLGGLQDCWQPHLQAIKPVVFEPNPPEAEAVRQSLIHCGGMVLEHALSDRRGRRKLHVAKSLGCTSILKPNHDFLSAYSVAPAFVTTHELEVDCVRYDELFAAGVAPAPDVIKVDVQGYEFEVLNGFGDLLNRCLAIQLEAHLYRIYKKQKLLHHLVNYLHQFGLNLRKLQPVQHFDGDVVEVDAWFLRDPCSETGLNAIEQTKLQLVSEVWGIPPHRNVFSKDQFI